MAEVAATASPLADSFQRCSRSFKQLYLSLFAYGPISLSKFNDEYGRFGVWGSDSGADRTGRGSLDDVLRNDLTTASIIAELLKNLNDDLSICKYNARNPFNSLGIFLKCSRNYRYLSCWGIPRSTQGAIPRWSRMAFR